MFYVGTYSEPGAFFPNASGAGILSCRLSLETGAIQLLSANSKTPNASYLAWTPQRAHLLAIHDGYLDSGEAHSYALKKNGELQHLSSQKCSGGAACHISCTTDGQRVLVSSYLDTNLSVFDFAADGTLSPATATFTFSGSGPNQERQQKAHAHQAVSSPCGQWIYVCDLGSDKIWRYERAELDDSNTAANASAETPANATVSLNPNSTATPPGSGPRHLVFHPQLPLAYVFGELNACVLTYAQDTKTGELKLLTQQASLPESWDGTPSGAAIRLHPSGKALYVSNRDHNSVTVFAIQEDGNLQQHSNFSTLGDHPRDFNIDPSGRWLVVANLHSNTLVPFELDANSGLPTGKAAPAFECGTPACVLF